MRIPVGNSPDHSFFGFQETKTQRAAAGIAQKVLCKARSEGSSSGFFPRNPAIDGGFTSGCVKITIENGHV